MVIFLFLSYVLVITGSSILGYFALFDGIIESIKTIMFRILLCWLILKITIFLG